MSEKEILNIVTEFYLKSERWNGISFSELKSRFSDVRKNIEMLVRKDLVNLNFGDKHPNIHIQAYEPHIPEKQIELLESNIYKNFCVYPATKHLQDTVDIQKYNDKPFTRLMALGTPQLTHKAFDLRVLEYYRNDPRYEYKVNEIMGNVFEKEGSKLDEQDQIYLEKFGFAYSTNFDVRYIAAFTYYLSRLTSKHQKLWECHMVNKETIIHPDYVRIYNGNWGEGVSLFDAIWEELKLVYKMTESAFQIPLFRRIEERPKEFGFLIRTTLKEYGSFIHIVDKLVSDNLNKKFFENTPRLNIYDDDNKPKGTLRLLKEWLEIRFKTDDRKPINDMISFFKKIRKMRMKPAHKIEEDEWDSGFYTQQKEFAKNLYAHVRTLRQIFAGHPRAINIEIPDFLLEGKIWPF